MANYGKYYIAVRLLLLKQYLEANAGHDRIVKRGELEALLREHDMPYSIMSRPKVQGISQNSLFLLSFWYAILTKNPKGGPAMANYGKYYIAVRLLLLKQYLEANAGRDRIVKRGELEALLREHDMPVEKKTLYADFAALGDICGLQLDYDPHKKGYRLLNPPFEPYELRLLVDSVQSSKFITRENAGVP